MQKQSRSMRIGTTVATSGLKCTSAGGPKPGLRRALRGWFRASGAAYTSLLKPQTPHRVRQKPQGSGRTPRVGGEVTGARTTLMAYI